jgi:hypothetical protein
MSSSKTIGEFSPQMNGDLLFNNNEQISRIGCPVLFASGQFSDCTVRMELDEVQKADLGRKCAVTSECGTSNSPDLGYFRYARIDRRPLDPPPVIHLKIFRVQPDASSGKEIEIEVDYK